MSHYGNDSQEMAEAQARHKQREAEEWKRDRAETEASWKLFEQRRKAEGLRARPSGYWRFEEILNSSGELTGWQVFLDGSSVGIMVMLLLSVPVALGNFRNREGAILTTASLGAGLAFLVTDGLLNALGEGAALSPVLAAWTAPVVFAALATTALLKMEG